MCAAPVSVLQSIPHTQRTRHAAREFCIKTREVIMPTDLGRWTHALLRIAAGVLFLEHGLQKLFGFFGGVQGATVPLVSMFGAAGVLELVGGLLLILGLFTRPVAAL